MEKVTVKRKVYQTGEPYIDENGNIGFLLEADENSFHLHSVVNEWHCERLRVITPGTIEEAPLELEDGEWYMCDVRTKDTQWETPLYRMYSKWHNRLGSMDASLRPDAEVDPMYKMVKA